MVAVQGEVRSRNIRQFVAEAANLSLVQGFRLLLLDFRNVEHVPVGPVDIYYEAKYLTENTGVTQWHKQAIVVKERGDLHDFAEDVFANRGYRFRVFADLEEAKSWLKGALH